MFFGVQKDIRFGIRRFNVNLYEICHALTTLQSRQIKFAVHSEIIFSFRTSLFLKIKLYQLLQTHSLIQISIENLLQKLFTAIRYIWRHDVLDKKGAHLINQLLFALRFPWGFSSQHLHEDYSNCPDVTLEAIEVVPKGLGRHVERGADVLLQRSTALRRVYGESEIPYKQFFFIVYEYIGWFEISMKQLFVCYMLVPPNDLSQKNNCSCLTKLALALNQVKQRSFTAIISNQINIVGTPDGLDQLKNVVAVFELSKSIHLCVGHGNIVTQIVCLQIEHLNGHLLSLLEASELLRRTNSPVYFRRTAPAEHILLTIAEAIDGFKGQ